MFGLSKSFYAKVFFLFIATTLAMFILNQLLIGRIGGGQMRKVFIERQININLRWEKEPLSEKTADELKEESHQKIINIIPSLIYHFLKNSKIPK